MRGNNLGLLTFAKKFLDYKTYTNTRNIKQKLILVYFSDRILDIKAEEIGMRVRLQNKFATLPFESEAIKNFAAFNASQRLSLFNKIFEEEFDISVLS